MRSAASPVAVTTVLLLVACATDDGSNSASAETVRRCQAQVILTLATVPAAEPDQSLLADLGRQAQAQLTFLRLVTPGVEVLSISADDPSAKCSQTLERLRADPRVRSVNIDERRQPNG